jgi:hypothetical protein
MSDSKSDRLLGPTRSRAAIIELEAFLKKNCEEAQRVSHILQTFQYETGHEPRKTMQYMEAIQSVGKIRLFKNDGELYVQWGRNKGSEPEEKSETPFMDAIHKERGEIIKRNLEKLGYKE